MINKLHDKLNDLNSKYNRETYKIKDKLQTEYNKIYSDWKALQDAIKELDSSSNYTTDQFGEIESYIRFDMSKLKERELDFFREYLSDYCDFTIVVDFSNGILSRYEGPGIIINSDGDIYDQESQTWILKKDDYTLDYFVDINFRNLLIEKHMEETGYFPGVYSQDYHGNIEFVRTSLPFNESELETFLSAYIEAALFAETASGYKDEEGNSCEDESFRSLNFNAYDLSEGLAGRMKVDCLDFLKNNYELIKDDLDQAGHDFWLTRQGHGAGFWDGDWPKDKGDKLTDASKAYGSMDLYACDNGEIDS